MKRLLAIFLAMLMLTWGDSAYASGDSGCYPEWKVKQSDYNGCSGTALLSPGNDTRINLLMLLSDRHGSVGPAGQYYAYDSEVRRGEAEPFDWATFAHALGPSPKGAEDDETGNFPFGTRCMSNMTGSAEFVDAVAKAKGLSAEERATLTAVRVALNPQCADAKTTATTRDSLAGVKSKAGRAFADYLIGAAAFYDGAFEEARIAFEAVGKGAPAWPGEAASYMLGRVALQTAMAQAFDEYGGLVESHPEPGLLDNAYEGLQSYLKAYPQGRYAASARGLLRRVYWLGGDQQRLAEEYAALFRQKRGQYDSFPDLVQETDIKLLEKLKAANTSDPLLLATLSLRAMRRPNDPRFADYGTPPITRAALDAQRSKFAGNEALFGYLQAAHAFYVANNAAEVLKIISASSSTDSSYLGFSRQLLRALALDASGNAAARPALLALVAAAKKPHQRGSAELALAMHDERAKAVDNVFAANSAIRDPDVREILLRYHAGPSLLRSQAASKTASERERSVALYTLLYKQLTRGGYSGFLKDVALVPAGTKPPAQDDYYQPGYTNLSIFGSKIDSPFGCAPVRGVASSLANNPRDAAALLCLGEFARINGLDPDFYSVPHYLDDLPPKDELGGTPSQFPGAAFSRLEIYKTLIADPAVSANNKSYALYRAINCYGPSGNNGCGGTEVSEATRKSWFNRLKKDHATSTWAKQQKYYW